MPSPAKLNNPYDHFSISKDVFFLAGTIDNTIRQTRNTSEEAAAAKPAAIPVLRSLPPPLVKEMINHWCNDVRL